MKYTLTVLLIFSLYIPTLLAQNCNTNLNGMQNYSDFGCPSTITGLDIGGIGNNERLTFNTNLTISGNGNINLTFEGTGSEIIIASGVTVTVTGSLNFNGSNGPKDFIVNGALIVQGNVNAQSNITYGGTGQITIDGTWQNNGDSNGADCTSPCNLTFDVANCLSADSPICQAAAANPLPITLLNFEVQYQVGKLYFTWQTLLEENNEQFTIEVSKDGENYTALATEDGAGNHVGLLSYQREVAFEGQGQHYFRLKQTDTDGKFSYSGIQPLKIDADLSGIKVYRDMNTPQYIYVESIKSHAPIEILINDALGRVLYHEYLSSSQHGLGEKRLIQLNQGEPGLYIVKLLIGNESKIIKI